MNFNFNEEQQMLKESMHRWFQDNYSFDQRRMLADSELGFSPENWNTFAEMGWLSIPFAERFGGFGGSIIDTAAMMEEFGKVLLLEPAVSTLILFGGLLESCNNEQLAAKSISRIIDGSLLGSLACYETQSRFETSSIATTAEATNEGYSLNGEKSLVLGGAHAHQFIVAARSSGEQSDEAGISLFLVDAESEGLSRKAFRLMDGQRVVDLVLDKVTVTEDALLCELGCGYPLLAAVIERANVALAAEALGIMHRLNTITVEYAKTRKQFGVPISSFQALQHRMVDTFMAYEQSKSLLYGTLCELTDETTTAGQRSKAVNGLRTLIARNGKLIGDEAIQMHGGMGITDELDVGHYVKRLMMINLMFGSGDYFQKQYNQQAYQALPELDAAVSSVNFGISKAG